MKMVKLAITILIVISIFGYLGCRSGPRVRILEMENKGSITGESTPNWVRDYIRGGTTRVQAQRDYRDVYVIIGEATGVNLEFTVNWANNFSAQQRIGAMLRTTIASEYQARVQGMAQSAGGGTPATAGEATGIYQQEIDSTINSIVNVSYSGAVFIGDWWSLRRRYDPDIKGAYSDEYTAFVMYTIPKAELNRQVARALETSVSADSALYDITIEIARQLMQNGIANWGE